jgi:hypothetical protein
VKLPVIVPRGCTSVGTLGSILAQAAWAVASLGRMDAGCHIGGKLAAWLFTGGYEYGVHSTSGSVGMLGHSSAEMLRTRRTGDLGLALLGGAVLGGDANDKSGGEKGERLVAHAGSRTARRRADRECGRET